MNYQRPTPIPAFVPPPARHPQRRILKLSDGYETSVYVHHPPTSAPPEVRPVLYVHGIQSHPGWFYGSAMILAEAGHTVFQVTRRGSGDNTTARGHARSMGVLLEDMKTVCDFVLDEADAKQLHLLGVSWGGKLATAFAAGPSATDVIASLTLVAPGIKTPLDVSFTTKLLIAASLLVWPRWRFAIPLNDVELFTDNDEMRDYLREDPYRLHKATAKLLYVSRTLDRKLARTPPDSLTIPTTLILAGRDRIIDNAATEQFVKHLSSNQLRTVELDGAHTLEFEPDPAPLYRAIIEAVDRGEVNVQSSSP